MAEDSSEVVRETVEGQVASNAKVTMSGPSFYQNAMYGQAVTANANLIVAQQMGQGIILALGGKIAESIIAMSPNEGAVDVAGAGQLARMLGLTPSVPAVPASQTS